MRTRTIPLGLTLLLGPAAGARAEQATTLNVEAGTVKYSVTEGTTPKQGNAQVLGVEYCRFFRLDRCYMLGYRQALDPATQRNYYFAAYAGMRFYPRHLGFPVDEAVGDDNIHLDATLKPYIDGSVALGRALYGTQGLADLSADILGLNLGVGLTWHPVSRWVVDTGVKYEQYQQNGGNSSSLALTGSNQYLLLGTGYLF